MGEMVALSKKWYKDEVCKLRAENNSQALELQRLRENIQCAMQCLERETTCVMEFGESWTQRAYNFLRKALNPPKNGEKK